MFTPPPPGTPVETDDDLGLFWRRMMGAGGFARRSLWLVWFDAANRSLPVVAPFDDVPAVPDRQLVDGLVRIAGQICSDVGNGSAAMLLSRPGGPAKHRNDVAWAWELTSAARQSGVSMWPVHLATRDRVQAFFPDDFAAAG